jgi:hypothetical protein
MDNLYYLEKMIITRMREVQRRAESRTRLGLRHWRAQPTSRRLRKLAGGWMIRAGAFLLRANPDSEAHRR